MTEQKLRTVMQRSAAEPSEGFDERIALQLQNLTRKEEPGMKRTASIMCLGFWSMWLWAANFRFAQLTDIHVSPSNPSPLEDLRRSVDEINTLDSIDFVLVSGDITEAGDRYCMELCKEQFRRLKIPYYITYKEWKARKGSNCHCVGMVDIGVYNSCNHLCKYCYANFDETKVAENIKKHNPNSSLLIGELQQDDIIKERYK